MLNAELDGAERVLTAGRRVVTWSPAALTHFSGSCRGVVEHVKSVATKLVNITHRLNDYLEDIKATNLLVVGRVCAEYPNKRLPMLSVSLITQYNTSIDNKINVLFYS